MVYYPENRQLGPNIDTTWGTYGTRHTQFDPEEYVQRQYPWPQDIRTGHGYAPQPGYGPPAPYNAPRPMGAFHDTSADMKLSTILLLAGVAILAYFIGKDSGSVKRNPTVLENRTGKPCACSCGAKRRRRSRRMLPVATRRRKLRRQACTQPRDQFGRFVMG